MECHLRSVDCNTLFRHSTKVYEVRLGTVVRVHVPVLFSKAQARLKPRCVPGCSVPSGLASCRADMHRELGCFCPTRGNYELGGTPSHTWTSSPGRGEQLHLFGRVPPSSLSPIAGQRRGSLVPSDGSRRSASSYIVKMEKLIQILKQGAQTH